MKQEGTSSTGLDLARQILDTALTNLVNSRNDLVVLTRVPIIIIIIIIYYYYYYYFF